MSTVRTRAAVVVCALEVLGSMAAADWVVTKWAGDGTAWVAFELERRIEISGPGTYKFSVTENGEPGDLRGLTILPDAGDVTVHLEAEMGGPGVRNLGATRFGNNSTLKLARSVVAGEAGGEDVISAAELSDVVWIQGDVVRPIMLSRLSGTLACKALSGLYASSSEATAEIRTTSDVTGPIVVEGNLARLQIFGDVLESIETGALDVLIVSSSIGGERSPSMIRAPITIGGDVAWCDLYMHCHADVRIRGRMPDANIWAAIFQAFIVDGDVVLTGLPQIGVAATARLEFRSSLYADVDCTCGGEGDWTIADVLYGDLTMGGVSPIAGAFQIGNLAGALNASLGLLGSMEIGKIVSSGSLRFQGGGQVFAADVGGTITIGRLEGDVTIGSPVEARSLSSRISVGEVAGGLIKVYGDMKPAGPNAPAPYIQVDGAFGPYQSRDSLIEIDGQFLGDGRFITIDFDGYDPYDRWEGGSQVRIGTQTYTGNTPQDFIYEVTRCKGDLDNDGDVDFDDIDPFVAALEPGATYDATLPGLAGSRVFHGDFTGDGLVTFDDLDPFIARLGYCSPQGGYLDEGGGEGGGEGDGDGQGGDGDGDGGDGDGGMMMSAGGGAAGQAAALAAQLRASVSAERMDTLIDAVTALAANPPDGSTIPWDLVLVELMP